MSHSSAQRYWLRPLLGATAGFLRSLTFLYRVLRKTDDTCPACRRIGAPLYRCPHCGALHDDLRPSAAGLETVSCSCGLPLATIDTAGRDQYQRVCRHPDCRRDWPPDGPGRVSAYHVVVLGRPKGWLLRAVRRLTEEYAPDNQVAVSFLDPDDAAAVRLGSAEQDFRAEQRYLALRVTSRDGRAGLLYLYDFTGQVPGEFALPAHLDGLLYGIHLPEQPGEPALPATMFRGRRFDVPLALVLFDGGPDGPGGHDLAGFYAGAAVAAQEAERDSAAVRLFLVHKGVGDFANALELRFAPVAFFAAAPEARQRGLLAPLIWLTHHAGALRDEPAAFLAVSNLFRYTRRALQGREGRHAWNTGWGCILIGTPLVLIALGWKFGAWAAVLALLALLALGFRWAIRRSR